jgi:hypothetical protein
MARSVRFPSQIAGIEPCPISSGGVVMSSSGGAISGVVGSMSTGGVDGISTP